MHFLPPFKTAIAALLGLALTNAATSAPLLRCEVSYAGSTHVIETHPVTDPYPVPSVDIGGRFWFKPVMVGSASQVAYVKLYTYLDTRTQPLLVHEAIHLPPFPTTTTPFPLTGQQHVFAGPVERELMYSCTLQGVQP